MLRWNDYFQSLNNIIHSLEITMKNGLRLDTEDGLSLFCDKVMAVKKNSRVAFFTGNGASASMASHFSADLAKNLRLKTMVFTDLSLMTAMANDEGYEKIYSDPLSIWGGAGDILLTISSSGSSANIVEVLQYAEEKNLFSVTFSAMDRNNVSRRMGDLNFYLPADDYGSAEVLHAVILHYLTDCLVEQFKGESLAPSDCSNW